MLHCRFVQAFLFLPSTFSRQTSIAISPVLLGAGERLFDGINQNPGSGEPFPFVKGTKALTSFLKISHIENSIRG